MRNLLHREWDNDESIRNEIKKAVHFVENDKN